MFDFLRNITKSAEEKRHEQVNAYVDGELSPREQEQFEQELAQDPALRAEVDELRQIQMSVRQLPRVRAPRNYTLDPAVYGQPARAQGWQLYPALRLATALTAFFFVLALALDLLTPVAGLGEPVAALIAPSAGQEAAVTSDTAAEPEVAMQRTEETMAAESAPAEEPAEMAPLEAEEEAAEGEQLEVTRVVTEEVEEPAAAEEAAEEPVEEAVEEEAATEGAEATMPAAAAPAADEAGEDNMAGTATANGAATLAEEADGDEADMAPPPLGTPADDAQAFVEPTPAIPTVAADSAAQETAPETQPEPEPEPFPWLLLAEILLGVGLVGLVIMTLVARGRV